MLSNVEKQFKDLPSLGVPNPDKDPCIKTYWEKILDDGSPDDVNKVKPHNIRVIAGIGDSLTIGSRSANSEADFGVAARFPGNAFFTGADDGIEKHITLHNILQCLSSKLPTAQLIGGSHGNGMDNVGFDVAIGGMKIDDFPRQAAELVAKISTHPKIKLDADWKLVSVFFGTNDVGKLSGHSEADPISREVYKAKMEEGLSILKKGLPRTIVSIVAMFQPQLLIEAGRIIETGERPGDKAAQDAIDEQCSEYQQVAFEVQNEGKFDSQNFTVVVQPFAVDIKDAFRNAAGSYDKSFYAWDEFHLSKLGNAIIAKALWKNLLEPVGAKNTRVDLADMQPTIACVNVDFPYIRTVGNSK